MPRIEFDGIGDPIPTIALPPFGSAGIPPTVLTFTENTDFSVQLYRDLGFTHYEVWCVGAAGGRGSDATSQMFAVEEVTWQTVPQDVWNLRLEQVRIQDYFTSGQWDYAYSYGPGVYRTAPQNLEYNNPQHMLQFRTYRQMLAYPSLQGIGGAGGGGGMRKVVGLLADLDATLPIVVGKAGLDSPPGQIHQPTPWTPSMGEGDPTHYPSVPNPAGYPYPTNRLYEILAFFRDYLYTYPAPRTVLNPPVAGGSGGYSSFGAVCQASGGEGGDPGMAWDGVKFVLQGNGGDGGVGGQTAPGGGGAGSASETENGTDGIWRPETGIGEGGGGGKGGRGAEVTGDPRFGVPTTINHLASGGGQGSYSFDDTSVYGQRQNRLPWTYLKPIPGSGPVSLPGPFGLGAGTEHNGTVTFVLTTDPYLATPGGGGGARPTRTLKVGSHATGYSPDGVVVVRLTQIND